MHHHPKRSRTRESVSRTNLWHKEQSVNGKTNAGSLSGTIVEQRNLTLAGANLLFIAAHCCLQLLTASNTATFVAWFDKYVYLNSMTRVFDNEGGNDGRPHRGEKTKRESKPGTLKASKGSSQLPPNDVLPQDQGAAVDMNLLAKKPSLENGHGDRPMASRNQHFDTERRVPREARSNSASPRGSIEASLPEAEEPSDDDQHAEKSVEGGPSDP